MTTPRIYVASLSDYNSGRLHGRWIDAAQDPDAIMEEVQAMLSESKEPNAEEWAIHDHEGFMGLTVNEHSSIEEVADMAAAIEEHGEAYVAYVGLVGADYATPEGFEESYQGEWPDREEWGCEQLAEQLEQVPESLRSYVDVDAWARDQELSGEVSFVESESGTYVFSNR